ncbi:hypothetical protein KFK09_011628 [Dendrobium nobile]|uniref:Uncharacterized protein n=1 Tax=Dendrobium nobile TaxID=94219 RepID=A0A8T3BFF0_DENNO|nr:hypothetical protein KFK09_011628 [Dendrobium nobile]
MLNVRVQEAFAVIDDEVILNTHITKETNSAHFLLVPSTFFFKKFKIILFSTSIWPFVFG